MAGKKKQKKYNHKVSIIIPNRNRISIQKAEMKQQDIYIFLQKIHLVF